MRIGDLQFFQPTRAKYADPFQWNLEPANTWFVTEDGVCLHGWYFSSAEEPVGTVIHCHGYRGNVTGAFPFATWLLEEGYRVLCFDYRGYGQSEGRPCREGLVRDVRAAIDCVVNRDKLAERPVYLFGQSLGGAVGLIASAGRADLAGVVVDGTFTDFRVITADSIQRVVGSRRVAEVLAWMLVSPGPSAVRAIGDVRCPVLIMSGRKDRIVDTRHARQLYDSATGKREIWVDEAGGHCNSIMNPSSGAREVMIDFLRNSAHNE